MTTHQETPSIGLDDPWLAEPPKRSRLRLVLVVLLAGACVFYAGVEVQKRYGTAGSASSTGPLTGAFTPPDGATFPGGGLLPGGATDEQPDDETASTSVIGKVVSRKGDKLVVEDFGGTRHTVSLGTAVRVVRESEGDVDDVKRGNTVEVTGRADDTGQVTATTITVR